MGVAGVIDCNRIGLSPPTPDLADFPLADDGRMFGSVKRIKT